MNPVVELWKEFLERESLRVEEAGDLLCRTLLKGKKVLIAGNGGSATQASHFAAELAGNFAGADSPQPAISLSSDTGLLTALANEPGAGIANVHLDAVDHRDSQGNERLVFMHAVREGPANRSFGLQVAALAGLPRPVIAQARTLLERLESGMTASLDATPPRAAAQADATSQLSLFAPPAPSPAEETLRALDPDGLSPREALDALYRLRRML